MKYTKQKQVEDTKTASGQGHRRITQRDARETQLYVLPRKQSQTDTTQENSITQLTSPVSLMQTHNTTNTYAKQRDGMQGKDDYYTQSPRTKSQMKWISRTAHPHTHKKVQDAQGQQARKKVHSRCTHKKVMRHKETAGRKTSKKACLHLTSTYTHTHTPRTDCSRNSAMVSVLSESMDRANTNSPSTSEKLSLSRARRRHNGCRTRD